LQPDLQRQQGQVLRVLLQSLKILQKVLNDKNV
jgi:hypothetical protein